MTIHFVQAASIRRAAIILAALVPAAFAGCGELPEDQQTGDDVTVATSAITQVINVSNVAQLYAAFSIANTSSNVIEIHLAPGTYSLRDPSATDPTDTQSFSVGSLKVTHAGANVKLIGGRDITDAKNYVIDGGASTGRRTGLLYVNGRPNNIGQLPRPTVTVSGVVFQNGYAPTAHSPVTANFAVLSMTNSAIVNTQTDGQGGGGLYVNTTSNVTITRCVFENNVLGAALQAGACGGFFDDGGGAQISNSTALIQYSSFIFGKSCRGGGLFVSGSPSDTFTIVESTFSNNEAKNRGGGLMIFGAPKVTLKFNTISANTAATQGSGLDSESHIAGGLSIYNPQTGNTGTLAIHGNLIAQNRVVRPAVSGTTSPDGVDCYLEGPGPAPTITQNRNLVGERGNCSFLNSSNIVGTHAAPINAQLYFLTDMGGGSFSGMIAVQPPVAGSPALHAYQANGTVSCPSSDQLGAVRVSPCTIGAVENAIS